MRSANFHIELTGMEKILQLGLDSFQFGFDRTEQCGSILELCVATSAFELICTIERIARTEVSQGTLIATLRSLVGARRIVL